MTTSGNYKSIPIIYLQPTYNHEYGTTLKTLKKNYLQNLITISIHLGRRSMENLQEKRIKE